MKNSRILLVAAALAAVVSIDRANAYTIIDSTANQGGVSFITDVNHAGFNNAGKITATYTYNGPLSFNDAVPQNGNSSGDLSSNFFLAADISDYSGSGSLGTPANANFSTISTFVASSGSASNYQYGSLIMIDLDILAKGTQLTITHDDGASVYQGGSMIGTMTDGPTTAVTEMVTLTSTADTILY